MDIAPTFRPDAWPNDGRQTNCRFTSHSLCQTDTTRCHLAHNAQLGCSCVCAIDISYTAPDPLHVALPSMAECSVSGTREI
ncbi:hypothetical protein VFPPC_15713 [Pochonia chlamydosporia 170]|uniref:Uncharacterized protein n=1 Tax=Pochonia chlamydosporia 170 TaxID=1380566 RepID=A0A179FR75_METCM|nr:hypothetical protein VFPPC_15713 [Pochonia chlamydosporia 170]OAQ67641.1 hypothetical protein VFPPC_15713 [Pochonia chlamydosporia 170]